MKETACAFTGHRPKSFPWKYKETAPDCVLLKETLAAQIRLLADSGVTDWLSGMALGVDLWCAQIVLSLKEKNPALRLHCILPCEGQEVKWPKAEQEQYHSILKRAMRWYMSAATIIRTVCWSATATWWTGPLSCWQSTMGHGAAERV